jgi:hypothetical protein
MALQKFKEFIRDRQRPVSRRSEPYVLKEGTDDAEIVDAATVIIGSELSASERKQLTDDLLTDIRKMSEGEGTAVALK